MKIDELDYLESSKTIYDIIEKSLPIFNGDFSTSNLIDKLLVFDDKLHVNEYKKIMEQAIEILRGSVDDLDDSGTVRYETTMDEEESETFLKRLKSFNTYHNTNPRYSTLEEYYKFTLADENIVNPKYTLIRQTLVRQALIHAAPEYIKSLRSMLISQAYMPVVLQTNKKIMANGTSGEQSPEYEELKEIQQFTLRADRLYEYDNVLETMRERRDSQMEKAARAIVLDSKRVRFIRNELIKTIPEEKVEEFKKSGIDFSTLFFDHKESEKQNSFETWDIKEFEKPHLILNETANYTPEGSADQKVIAVSYGKFVYGLQTNQGDTPKISNGLVELVCISRIGEDGQKDYFVLVPFQGKQKNSSNTNKQYIDSTSVIPENLRKFYANIFFSDTYLKSAIKENHRFAGLVHINEDGPTIEANDSYQGNAENIEAAKFAQNNYSVGYHFPPLATDYSIASIRGMQYRIVRDILEEEKKNKDNKEVGER